MYLTNYARKLDSLGRLVIPAPLRGQLGLETSEIYDFYTHEENGEVYLCIKCANASPQLEEAKQILQQAGYTINK